MTEIDTRTGTGPLLLDAEQASKRLGTDSNGRPLVSAHWLRRKAGKRLIPCTYIGTKPRWSEQDLLELIEQRRRSPSAPGQRPR